MSLSLKPPIARALRAPLTYAARAQQQVAAGLSDARVASLKPPGSPEHFRRFVYGFAMPVTLLRIAWSNPDARRSMRLRLLPPLVLVAAVAAAGSISIATTVATARHDPRALAKELEQDDDDNDSPRDEADLKKHATKGEAAAKAVREAQAKGASQAEIATAAIEAATSDEPPVPPTPAPTGFAAAARVVLAFLTSRIAKLIATLSILEWILVWIGREHHDQISFEMAGLSGVPGEALAGPPRLHMDVEWLKVKGWRALRLLIFLALVSPVAWLVGRIPYLGGPLGVVVEAAWAVYWACVFAVANSFLVWDSPASERPWFMRTLERVTRVPLIGVPFRVYARIVGRLTRPVWPACMAFEQTTFESAGLALARVLASLPIVYVVTRPAFATAATHALLARAAPAEDATFEPPPENEREAEMLPEAAPSEIAPPADGASD